MSVRIRLQRHGKKGKPFYWIVAADQRSKRDGKYLEKLGTYDPNFNPPIVDLNIDASVNWIQLGAQPSDTAKSIMSKEGVLLKNHLLNGVKKGALSQEDADKKFEDWINDRNKKTDDKLSQIQKDLSEKKKKELALEKEASEKRKLAAIAAAEEATAEEAAADEAPAEEPAAEEPAAEETPDDEAPAEEAPADEALAEEAPAEEPSAEEPAAEEPAADEAPAEEESGSEIEEKKD
jgi:small subunit ribosomal protein S16